MKKINKLYKSACLMGLIAVTTTSCEDWLTIYPLDKVVEEEFWEDKNDLEGVRYGAYKQMGSTVDKLAVWGDLRSDSYELNTKTGSQSNYDDFQDIRQGMPDSSMGHFDWAGVYTTINYCNKVLQHGPEVLENDKQFTRPEWNYMHAEMKALRALNYFYLLRAFKDIPYTTAVINTDSEVKNFKLTPQLDVLDSIILDCESVAGRARTGFSNIKDSKGMITNAAIYAMLADMYLWRASLHQGRFGLNSSDSVKVGNEYIIHTVIDDYQKCSDYADSALVELAEQKILNTSDYGVKILKTKDWGLSKCKIQNCQMLENDFIGVHTGTTPKLEAHTAIFHEKNSYESIFEIQFSQSDGRGNGTVNSLYGFGTGTHLAACEEAISKIYANNDDMKHDSRIWTNVQMRLKDAKSSSATSNPTQSKHYCVKYMNPQIELTEGNNKELTVGYTSDGYNNWIVYRMTDVMLMKAEALAYVGGADNFNKVKYIVNAIHRRSFCDYDKGTPLDDNVTSNSNVGNLISASTQIKDSKAAASYVMNERMIELLGEGKRWFDLVRYAERNCNIAEEAKTDGDERESTPDQFIGSGITGMKDMVKTYLKTTYGSQMEQTLVNRFKNRYGLYCPIYEMEVKASRGNIPQNPVWNKSKYDN